MLLAVLLRKINWTGLGAVLRRVDIVGAAGASTLTFLLIALLAARWRIFLRQQNITLSFRTVFSLTWAGQFFNSILPGSTGGDVVKIYQLCRMLPEKKAAASVTVIIDRMSALVALAAMAGVAFLFGPAAKVSQLGLSSRAVWPWVLAGSLGLALASLLAWRVIRSPHWLGRLRHLVGVLKTSFALNWNMALALAIAFGVHFLNFAIVFFFARTLGIAITYTQVLLIMPVVLLLVMLPLTINGHGLREVLLIFYFTQMRISLVDGSAAGIPEIAIGLSMLLVANDLLWALPGGLWYLAASRQRVA